MKRARIVEVEWVDICSTGRWTNKPKLGVLHCVSVGMLIHKCRQNLALVQTSSETGDWTDTITIPRKCISRVRNVGTSRRAPQANFPCEQCGGRR